MVCIITRIINSLALAVFTLALTSLLDIVSYSSNKYNTHNNKRRITIGLFNMSRKALIKHKNNYSSFRPG